MTEFGPQSVILIGDFNVHDEEWLGCRTTDSAGGRALKVDGSFGPQQIVTEPTRENQTLDLVLTDLSATTTTFACLGT